MESDQRFIKCHLPFEIMKENVAKRPELKIIQTMRNPKDTITSWYFHNKADELLGCFDGTWEEFFQLVKACYTIFLGIKGLSGSRWFVMDLVKNTSMAG